MLWECALRYIDPRWEKYGVRGYHTRQILYIKEKDITLGQLNAKVDSEQQSTTICKLPSLKFELLMV